jgi:hypothetical protein
MDGKPVRERHERLTELFVMPPPNALARATEVARESARYNVINIGTLNTPLTAISFLQPSYQPRFRLSGGSIDRKVGPDARVIQYAILRRRQASATAEERTAGSGRLFQPQSQARALFNYVAALPFRALQAPFARTDVGIGYIVLARLRA